MLVIGALKIHDGDNLAWRNSDTSHHMMLRYVPGNSVNVTLQPPLQVLQNSTTVSALRVRCQPPHGISHTIVICLEVKGYKVIMDMRTRQLIDCLENLVHGSDRNGVVVAILREI